MSRITCPLCGSNDFSKVGEFMVCGGCQTQYTIEEAKKLMFDNSTQGQPSVQVSLENARRAYRKEDWEETEKYYNMVEQYEPSNIEAVFYSSYAKAVQTLTNSDPYKRQEAFKVFSNTISIISDNFDMSKEDEQRKVITQAAQDIMRLYGMSYVYNKKVNGYGLEVSNDKSSTLTMFNNANEALRNTIMDIVGKIPSRPNNIEVKTDYISLCVNLAEHMLKNGSLANPVELRNRITAYHEEWHRVDSSHDVPISHAEQQPSSSGLSITTAFLILLVVVFFLVVMVF